MSCSPITEKRSITVLEETDVIVAAHSCREMKGSTAGEKRGDSGGRVERKSERGEERHDSCN